MARNSVTIQLILEGRDAKRSIDALEREFGDLERAGVKSTRNIDKSTDRLTDTNSRASKTLRNGLIAGYAALGFAAQQAVSRAIERGKEFETQLANLSAITGIVDKNLDRLGDNAIELSKQYGVAASNIIEANKLVASQLAERIDFQTEEGFQQLQEVSEQAVVLATAAGTDLASAVETTTSVINQFNLSASESERVINTLAAGAKFGAAEVPAIGRALVNAGAAASGAGQSIEATNAAIQVLAANGQVGERAGTALRAIFTRLQTESEKLAELGLGEVNVKANGLADTLRQLQPAVDRTTELSKIFGQEALNQIQILIRNADAVADLEEKVTDTNIAYEQASIQLDTFEGATNRLSTTIDGELIQAFQEADGVTVKLINTVSSLVSQFAGGIRVINSWFQANTDAKRAAALQEAQTESQINAMRDLRRELANAAIDGDLTAEQQMELEASFRATTENLKTQRDELQKNTDALHENRQALFLEIQELESYNGLAPSSRQRLERLKEEYKGLTIEIDQNYDSLVQLTEQIKAGEVTFEDFVQSTLNANDAVNQSSGELDGATISALNYLSTLEQLGRALNNFDGPEQEVGVDNLEDATVSALNYLNTLNKIDAALNNLKDENEEITEETRALLGVANLVGNAFLEMAIHGREFDDVLKGILAQLASKAFVIGIGTLLTGGVPGGGTFFEALFSGFATGVTDFRGGTALVGEEGPELVNLPRGANVITNENTNRLIDSANKMMSSPSAIANNVANTSVQNISQRVDMGNMSKEVGRAVNSALSGARLTVGSMGELMVEFRRESRRQKDLGGNSFMNFEDV